MPNLYIVATPIGNMEDITYRAVRILKEADFVLCEDTRVTAKLLTRYEIGTPTISYHQHSDEDKINYLLGLLKDGKNLALVTDAGTPGISDPGGQLVEAVRENLEDVGIVPIPGPSALAAAASISGMAMDKFVFMGNKASQLKQVGNAVPPLLAFCIAKSVRLQYNKAVK